MEPTGAGGHRSLTSCAREPLKEPRMKRALIVALPAILAFGLVACGDDDDSVSTEPGSVTTTTERESETDSTDRSVTLPDLSDVTIPDISLPSDFTLPGGITIPENIGSLLPGG